MHWGAVVWIVLGIVGAGLVFGGIVAFRGHKSPAVRAMSAAAITSGLAMWAVIGFTVPASTSSDNGESPSPAVATSVVASDVVPLVTYEPLSEEEVAALLTTNDVNGVTAENNTLTIEFRDGRAMAAGVDASQVTEIESWYTAAFQSVNPIRGLTFSVMDFSSAGTAQGHFDSVIGETPGLVFMDPPIGDTSAHVVFNGQGLGSIVMYRYGDLFVSLHTAQPTDVQPMMPVSGLEELARLVLTRIG